MEDIYGRTCCQVEENAWIFLVRLTCTSEERGKLYLKHSKTDVIIHLIFPVYDMYLNISVHWPVCIPFKTGVKLGGPHRSHCILTLTK